MNSSGGNEEKVDNLADRSASSNSISLMVSVKQWEKKERPYAGKTRQKERENIIINFLFLNDWTTRQHHTTEKAWREKEEGDEEEGKFLNAMDEGSEVVSIIAVV